MYEAASAAQPQSQPAEGTTGGPVGEQPHHAHGDDVIEGEFEAEEK